MTAVRIITVSFNSAACLPSMVAAVLGEARDDRSLVVIDNASGDASLQQARTLAAADPRIQVIGNPRNLGFGAACNQGAQDASEPLLLFLNPDCRLDSAALDALVATLESHPEIGLIGARVLNADGSEQRAIRRNDPTPRRVLASMPVLGRMLGGEGVEIDRLGRPEPNGLMRVDAVSGALMLIRRSLFEAVDGFDEGYFLHCEDLDLCRRVRAHGAAVAIDERVSAVHLKGASSRSRPLRVEWHKLRGMRRYFLKFDAAQTHWAMRVLLMCGLYLRFGIRIPVLLARSWARS